MVRSLEDKSLYGVVGDGGQSVLADRLDETGWDIEGWGKTVA